MKPKKRRKLGEERPGQKRRRLMDLEARELDDEIRLANAADEAPDEDGARAWGGDDRGGESEEVS